MTRVYLSAVKPSPRALTLINTALMVGWVLLGLVWLWWFCWPMASVQYVAATIYEAADPQLAARDAYRDARHYKQLAEEVASRTVIERMKRDQRYKAMTPEGQRLLTFVRQTLIGAGVMLLASLFGGKRGTP